jgi:hypothetical protein
VQSLTCPAGMKKLKVRPIGRPRSPFSPARGSAYVPLFAVWEHIASGTLVRLMAEQDASEEAFQALWPSGRLVTPKGSKIVEFPGVHLKAAVQPKWQPD